MLIRKILVILWMVPLAQARSDEWTVIPGERVGLITAESCEDTLRRAYGAANVRAEDIHLGEEMYAPGTVLFSGDPTKKLEILWHDAKTKCHPESVRVAASKEKTVWKTSMGITLGTSLRELEKLNGKAFTLSGYEWDYSGAITSWNGGKLQSALQEKIVLRLNEGAFQKLSKSEQDKISGDIPLSSNHEVLQKLNPKVSYVAFRFPASQDAKAFVTEAITEMFFRRNPDAVDKYVVESYIQNQPGLPQGRQAFKDYLKMLFQAFPDYSGKIENIVAEGDLVSIHFAWEGTHKGTFMGVAPTGKKITRRTADVLRVKDGKIVEHWGIVDQLDMLKALGVVSTKR